MLAILQAEIISTFSFNVHGLEDPQIEEGIMSMTTRILEIETDSCIFQVSSTCLLFIIIRNKSTLLHSPMSNYCCWAKSIPQSYISIYGKQENLLGNCANAGAWSLTMELHPKTCNPITCKLSYALDPSPSQ